MRIYHGQSSKKNWLEIILISRNFTALLIFNHFIMFATSTRIKNAMPQRHLRLQRPVEVGSVRMSASKCKAACAFYPSSPSRAAMQKGLVPISQRRGRFGGWEQTAFCAVRRMYAIRQYRRGQNLYNPFAENNHANVYRHNDQEKVAVASQQLYATNNRNTGPFGGDQSPFSIGSQTDPSDFLDISYIGQKYNAVEDVDTNNQQRYTNTDSIDFPEPEINANVATLDSFAPASILGQKQSTSIKEDRPNSNSLDQLKANLQQYRKRQSESLNKSIKAILSDDVINGICTAVPLPAAKEDLLKIKGIGPKKVEMFGTGILNILSAYEPEPVPVSISESSLENIHDDVKEIDSAKESLDQNESKSVANPAPVVILDKAHLRQELKRYRLQQAEGKPAYTIFTNGALDGIYESLPTTNEELLDVKGIGPKKVEMFGDDILAIVSKYTGLRGEARSVEGIGKRTMPVRPAKIDPESLTMEQRRAAEMVLGNYDRTQNVFITGSAGTGKSHLLRYIVETLQNQKKENKKNPYQWRW